MLMTKSVTGAPADLTSNETLEDLPLLSFLRGWSIVGTVVADA
jgi:hypothetical protein